jgi:hypothetical protein
MYMRLKLKKVDPAIDKRFLVALSGIMWSIVGIALCRLTFIWLSQSTANNAVWFGAAGILLSLLIHHFGFLRLVDKNIARIAAKEGKVCVFAFQPWKSYLIIAIMIETVSFNYISRFRRRYDPVEFKVFQDIF